MSSPISVANTEPGGHQDTAGPEPAPGACRNCGHTVVEDYCARCGQAVRDLNLPFRQLLSESLGSFLAFDARILRTLGPLVARPGHLTRDYLAGRRARYVPPLKLYLFISFTFFLLSALLRPSSEALQINVSDSAAAGGASAASAAPDDRSPPSGSLAGEQPSRGSAAPMQVGFSVGPEGTGLRWLDALLAKADEHPETVNDAFRDYLPTALFLLVPLYALMIKALYRGSGRLYFSFLIFAFHAQSVVFLSILATTLMVGLLPAAEPFAAFWLLPPVVSFFLAQRRVFGESRRRTAVKLAAALIGYATITAIGMLTTALIALALA